MDNHPPDPPGISRQSNITFSIDTIRKIQAASGLFLGSFVGVHLIETISAFYGPFAYNEALNFFRYAFRLYYHHPVIESLLATSAVAHVLSGWYLYSKRQTPLNQLPLYQRINYLSGMWLSLAIGIHFAGSRVPSLLLGEEHLADFSHNAHSFEGLRAWFFYPWYFALGITGTYHSIYGSIKALTNLKLVSPLKTSKILSSTILATATSVVVSLVLSGVIAFTDGLWFDVPKDKYPLWDNKVQLSIEAIRKIVTHHT